MSPIIAITGPTAVGKSAVADRVARAPVSYTHLDVYKRQDLARKRGEVTDFGKFLDPIADKLLVFSALLILLEHGFVNVWFVFIILLREFLVSALRMVASANGEVIAADKLGKCKTAVTMVSLCAFLLAIALTFWTSPAGVSQVALIVQIVARATMVAAVVLTVVSGAQYFWNARHVIFRV